MKKGYVLIALAALLFGFQGVLSRYLLNFGIPPLALAFLKTLFGAIFIFILMFLFGIKEKRIQKQDILSFAWYGIIGVGLFSYFIFAAIERTNVTTAITLMYTSGAFTIVLAAFFLKEKITRNKVVSVLITFVGTVLVVVGYNISQLVIDPLGILFGLLIGLTYGFYNVNSKRYAQKYNTWVANFYSVMFAVIFLGIVQNPVEILLGGMVPATAWKYILLLSFLTYGVAYTLFIQGFKTVEAGRGIIVANIEPVVSLLLARVFFKETMSLWQGIGFLLIFLAILLATRKEETTLFEEKLEAKKQLG